MIKFKHYLDYVNLKEDADITDKLVALLGMSKQKINALATDEITRLVKDLHQIDYDAVEAYATLPTDYGKLSFGQWTEIETFSNETTDNYRIAKELAAVLLGTTKDMSDIEKEAERILNLDIKVAVPLATLHVKKKKRQETGSQPFIRKQKALLIKQIRLVDNLLKAKPDSSGVGMPLSRALHKIRLKWMRFFWKVQRSYLRFSLSRIN